jgi:hypothetical protein
VRGVRTCAGAKVVSAFYFMIAQLKLRTHFTTTTPPSDIRSLSLLPTPLFYYLSFFLLFLDNQWLLAATPTYVPETASFAFYSTRVQYDTCASIRTHTITPSPPFPYRTYTHIIDAHYIHQLFLSRYNVTNPYLTVATNFFLKWDCRRRRRRSLMASRITEHTVVANIVIRPGPDTELFIT